MALIEFCLALPVLLTITLTGVETANLAITVLRVNQLAMMASDNAGRVRSSIDEQDVNEIMAGIRFAGSGIEFGANGRVIISSLEGNGQTGTKAGNKITWQRCFGAKNVTSSYGLAGAGANDASLFFGMGPAGQKITPVPNSALIFAEVRYTYHPIVVSAFMADRELSAIQAFTVRDRAQQTLTNTKSLPASAQRLCDTAHLSAT
ncbi:pilus assembly protein [Sphingomonas sp. UV9]|uniref:pilus assembly protein n=1 Tax=Sphingomonas sp. UV9 TaxID=1851410 RepID=UPI001F0BADDA|nr:pilus assembly protein [Sphingomonas sp. UV9]